MFWSLFYLLQPWICHHFGRSRSNPGARSRSAEQIRAIRKIIKHDLSMTLGSSGSAFKSADPDPDADLFKSRSKALSFILKHFIFQLRGCWSVQVYGKATFNAWPIGLPNARWIDGGCGLKMHHPIVISPTIFSTIFPELNLSRDKVV